MTVDLKIELLVLGSGPAGYNAAFRASDLGQKVLIVEESSNMGGVCLNSGCIPSKILLNIVKSFDEMNTLKKMKLLDFDFASFKKHNIAEYIKNVLKNTDLSLKKLAKSRGITIINGHAFFKNPKQVCVRAINKKTQFNIFFQNVIIAVGSRAKKQFPFDKKDPRIIYSNEALSNIDKNNFKKMLIVGAGATGLEIAQIYNIFGSKITLIDSSECILPGFDQDIAKFYQNNFLKHYNICLKTRVSSIKCKNDGLYVGIEKIGLNSISIEKFDAILVATGRTPNSDLINAQEIGLNFDINGFILTDSNFRTESRNIFAVGDVRSSPMVAHKAIREGKIASETISGKKNLNFYSKEDLKCIPTVVYTNPEIACVGISEFEADKMRIKYKKINIPWSFNSRALTSPNCKGITKVIYNRLGEIIGASIVGINAGELIAEVCIAIKTKLTSDQLISIIHAHPTLSESFLAASELHSGILTT